VTDLVADHEEQLLVGHHVDQPDVTVMNGLV